MTLPQGPPRDLQRRHRRSRRHRPGRRRAAGSGRPRRRARRRPSARPGAPRHRPGHGRRRRPGGGPRGRTPGRGGRPVDRLGEQRGRLRRRRPAPHLGRARARARHGEPRPGSRRLPHRREPLRRPRPARGHRQRVVAPGPAPGARSPAVRHGEGRGGGAHPGCGRRPRSPTASAPTPWRWARSATARSEEYRSAHPEVDAQMAALHPLGGSGPRTRSPRPSPSCSRPPPAFVNGVVLPVDGGRSVNGPDPEAT